MPCKIYSRSRFKVFKTKKRKNLRRNGKFKLFFIEVIFISIFTVILVYNKSINPIFETACSDKAKSIATQITNDDSTKVIEKYNYEDLFSVQRDEKRKY